MRVIAGTARRLALKTVPGMETRPTTDRIKETLFNILQPYIPDSTFLDLFSGSGGIGIEALPKAYSESRSPIPYFVIGGVGVLLLLLLLWRMIKIIRA